MLAHANARYECYKVTTWFNMFMKLFYFIIVLIKVKLQLNWANPRLSSLASGLMADRAECWYGSSWYGHVIESIDLWTGQDNVIFFRVVITNFKAMYFNGKHISWSQNDEGSE